MTIKVKNSSYDSGWSATVTVDGQDFFSGANPCDFGMSYSYDECLAAIQTMNINNLPIINEITGTKIYEDAVTNGTVTEVTSHNMVKDLIDYYLGMT